MKLTFGLEEVTIYLRHKSLDEQNQNYKNPSYTPVHFTYIIYD